MHENHYAKLLTGQTIRISDDHNFTCVYQGKTAFVSPCGKKYNSLRQFMISNWQNRGKTTAYGDAWKCCEKQLPDGNWVKCKKQVDVTSEQIVVESVSEETQLILLNETLQKQMDAIQKEKDIVAQRLKLLQTKREIESIDKQIQALHEKRQLLLQTTVDKAFEKKDLLQPYVNRVLDKLLENDNNRNLSLFLAPVAELFVLDNLKQQGFNVCESKDVSGLGTSHDLEIVKHDGSIVKVQVKGRADKHWGIMTGKKPYNVSDFDLLAYLHYEKMGDLSSAKLWYFPAEALMATETTMKTKVPAEALTKYCNKDAQENLMRTYF